MYLRGFKMAEIVYYYALNNPKCILKHQILYIIFLEHAHVGTSLQFNNSKISRFVQKENTSGNIFPKVFGIKMLFNTILRICKTVISTFGLKRISSEITR